MSVWISIGGAVCVAVAALGLVWSWRIWRKHGATRGMRAVAWSLLPLAAYLTNAVLLLGRIVSAIVRFAGSFVFSPKSWAGVIVVGVAALLFLASGGLPLLNWRKARERRKLAAAAAKSDNSPPAVTAADSNPTAGRTTVSRAGAGRPGAGRPGAHGPASPGGRKAAVPGGSADDDDMSDVQEILRRRGIK